MANMKDLTGLRFGKLVAIRTIGKTAAGNYIWLCKCDCGAEHKAPAGHLKSGAMKSCGCYKAEWTKQKFTTHGESSGGERSPEFQAWVGICARCQSPYGKDVKNYRDRGITICNRWKDSFENFLADMGRRPSPKCSIDRIDNSLGYEPGNCQWATPSQQQRNTRRSRFITFDGRTLTLTEWSEITGINRGTINSRLERGLTEGEALGFTK